MRQLIAAILISVVPSTAMADRYLASIAVALAVVRAQPAPAPQPAPGDVCDNCNGTGKLGDGTVSVTCPVCDGTGKKTTSPPAAQAVPNAVAIPKDGQLSPRGEWRWSVKAWAWQPVARTVTIPAQGHWVSERVCGKNGCRNVRRWVQASPARTVSVEGTSTPTRPAYPSSSRSGRMWRQNGHAPTAEHLATEHGIPLNYARSLTTAQRWAVHGDAHEGGVRWQYIR